MSIRDSILDMYPDNEFLFADGFDDAIIGVTSFNGNEVICYSVEKILDILMKKDGFTEEEAIEYCDYNIIGAYVGDLTPCYVRTVA